jgi:hypothetical protein
MPKNIVIKIYIFSIIKQFVIQRGFWTFQTDPRAIKIVTYGYGRKENGEPIKPDAERTALT